MAPDLYSATLDYIVTAQLALGKEHHANLPPTRRPGDCAANGLAVLGVLGVVLGSAVGLGPAGAATVGQNTQAPQLSIEIERRPVRAARATS